MWLLLVSVQFVRFVSLLQEPHRTFGGHLQSWLRMSQPWKTGLTLGADDSKTGQGSALFSRMFSRPCEPNKNLDWRTRKTSQFFRLFWHYSKCNRHKSPCSSPIDVKGLWRLDCVDMTDYFYVFLGGQEGRTKGKYVRALVAISHNKVRQ